MSNMDSLKSDIEDLKRSNTGFETENISLVKERSVNMQTIHDLTLAKENLQESYRVLLEAKEIEATKFNDGI